MKGVDFVPDKTIFLVDGTSFCYRSFFAIRELRNSKGFPTGAIFGFVNTLRSLIEKFTPEYLVICFDVSKETFRKDIFEDYKINRPPLPSEFKIQLPWIKKILEVLSIPVCEVEGFEADDVIATLAQKAKVWGFSCIVVSSDKDILQIVEDKKILFYNPNKELLLDEVGVKKYLGVSPSQVVELLALSGDSTDNIPGVKGIGPKRALQLINQFGDIQNILLRAEEINPSLRELILNSKDKLLLSRRLALLDRNVPLQIEVGDLKIGEPNYPALTQIFRELGFKSLLEKFSEEKVLFDETPAIIENFSYKEIENNCRKKEFIFYFGDESLYVFLGDRIFKSQPSLFSSILGDPFIKKVTYDFKSVLLRIFKNGFEFRGECFDIMIASYLLSSHQLDYSLENIVWNYLNKSYPRIPEAQKVYFIAKLYPLLKEKIEVEGLEKVFFQIEMPLVEVLAWMQRDPLSIDLDYLKKISEEVKTKLAEIEEEIFKELNYRFNLNSPQQLSEVLFKRLGLPPVKKTKTGFSTNEESLLRLRDKHPLIEKILAYRKYNKLNSTYLKPFMKQAEENKAQIFSQFSQTSTFTGRLASFSPNLQNIPIRDALGRKLRGAFISSFKNGFILSADYSQIELRILAHISKDENLKRAFLEGKDIHKVTAALFFNKKEEDIDAKERDFAKRINFGIVYGMSAYGLSKELEVSVEEAESFIQEYFFRYPRVKEYIDKTIEKAKNKGYVETIFGRRRFLENVNSPNKSLLDYALRQAINAPVQGSAADIIKLAMIDIYKKFKEKRLTSRLIIQIHDELVFDVNLPEKQEVITLVKSSMEKAAELSVPLEVVINSGRTWLQASK